MERSGVEAALPEIHVNNEHHVYYYYIKYNTRLRHGSTGGGGEFYLFRKMVKNAKW